jgi:hypothetical protein
MRAPDIDSEKSLGFKKIGPVATQRSNGGYYANVRHKSISEVIDSNPNVSGNRELFINEFTSNEGRYTNLKSVVSAARTSLPNNDFGALKR